MEGLQVEDGASPRVDRSRKPRVSRGLWKLCFVGLVGVILCAAIFVGHWSALGARLMAQTSSPPTRPGLAPLLGDGTAVDWWFAFKPTTAAFPRCSTAVSCLFGGEAMPQSVEPMFGLQYILASSFNGSTSPMQLHSDCLGNGEDSLAKTFQQVYSGQAPNFVLWNDQFYDDPDPDITPPCVKYCAKPWGHSKGLLAWDDDGTGFVLQVTTPDWPGSATSSVPRKEQGNTLGCCKDDNVLVAQHFLALRLSSAEDTLKVLKALQRASVVTDPKNSQLMKLSGGPTNLQQAARELGQQVLDNLEPFQTEISLRSGLQVRLIAKPSGLQVPPWHLISSLIQTPLRTATWWTVPAINSTQGGFVPGCWNASLKPSPEVQVALSGQWQGVNFTFLGRPDADANHAKLAHSLGSGPKLAVMGDMNQQGALNPDDNPQGTCDLSQNARGGLFFIMEDASLHADLVHLMTGETASYVSPEAEKAVDSTSFSCGGRGVHWTKCGQSGRECKYVKKADVARCHVDGHGCYEIQQLPASCQTEANELVT